jgi:hypothetical protein
MPIKFGLKKPSAPLGAEPDAETRDGYCFAGAAPGKSAVGGAAGFGLAVRLIRAGGGVGSPPVHL